MSATPVDSFDIYADIGGSSLSSITYKSNSSSLEFTSLKDKDLHKNNLSHQNSVQNDFEKTKKKGLNRWRENERVYNIDSNQWNREERIVRFYRKRYSDNWQEQKYERKPLDTLPRVEDRGISNACHRDERTQTGSNELHCTKINPDERISRSIGLPLNIDTVDAICPRRRIPFGPNEGSKSDKLCIKIAASDMTIGFSNNRSSTICKPRRRTSIEININKDPKNCCIGVAVANNGVTNTSSSTNNEGAPTCPIRQVSEALDIDK